MGRHSAHHLARRGPSTLGAATYVGRVGALAFALGVGAAVIGGTGLASADGTDPSGATTTPDNSVAHDTTPNTTPNATAETTTSTGAAVQPTSSVPDPPKMSFSGGVPTNRPAAAAAADHGSLPELLLRIPSQIVASFGAGAPTGVHTASGPAPHGTGRPTSDSRPAPQATTTVDDVTSPAVHTATAHAAVTAQTPATPAAVEASSTAESNVARRLAVSPSAAAVLAPTLDPVAPRVVNPIATVVATVLNALGFSPSATSGGSPVTPFPILTAALQLIHREIERFVTNAASAGAYYSTSQMHVTPVTSPGVPQPGDEVATAYGNIGEWMLAPGGQISDYGGQPYGGRTLLEPVNVIIVDPSSTSPTEATARLNAAMFWAGFPAQPIHSTGFQGEIDEVVYRQQPTGLLQGFSDNLFILPNDHGRIFGPDPVQTSSGYVWSGAFSTETLSIYNFLPAHSYVSSNMARTALAVRLIFSGQATYVGMVPLNNAVDTPTTTTGDHDGYAVVLRLT